MDFIHLRDENDQLKATIAYEELNSEIVYGTTIVSRSERQRDINKKLGRTISSSRLNELIRHQNEGDDLTRVKWGAYKKNGSITLNYDYNPTMGIMIQNGFHKLGIMSRVDFEKQVKQLRESILEYYL